MQKRRERASILIDQQVGSRVRMRRLMLNLSQTDLADGIGVTFSKSKSTRKA
jgi:DNA-binding XRE family transcriptional regulator